MQYTWRLLNDAATLKLKRKLMHNQKCGDLSNGSLLNENNMPPILIEINDNAGKRGTSVINTPRIVEEEDDDDDDEYDHICEITTDKSIDSSDQGIYVAMSMMFFFVSP